MEIAFGSLLLLLNACTISTPLQLRAAQGMSNQPVVAVTHAELLAGDRRKEFFRQSRELLPVLSRRPGYLGGSIRRTLSGDEAWTLTVWSSEAELREFIFSPEHSRAISSS